MNNDVFIFIGIIIGKINKEIEREFSLRVVKIAKEEEYNWMKRNSKNHFTVLFLLHQSYLSLIPIFSIIDIFLAYIKNTSISLSLTPLRAHHRYCR